MKCIQRAIGCLRIARPTRPVAESAVGIPQRAQLTDAGLPARRRCAQMLEGSYRRPGISNILDAGKGRFRLPGESAPGCLASLDPFDGFFPLLLRLTQRRQRLNGPPGIHHVTIAAVGRGGIVEAAVRPLTRLNILAKCRGDIIHRKSDQLPAQQRHGLQLEDRIAVLLVGRGIDRRLCPVPDLLPE